jgi:hypothetical protein
VVDENGEWCVLVQRGWASRDDSMAERAILALNGVGPKGGWVNEVLDAMLADLAASPSGLKGTGLVHKPSGAAIAALAGRKVTPLHTKMTRPMDSRWFLVRVPPHRVADVADHIEQIRGVEGVQVLDGENGGGRKAGRQRRRDADNGDD